MNEYSAWVAQLKAAQERNRVLEAARKEKLVAMKKKLLAEEQRTADIQAQAEELDARTAALMSQKVDKGKGTDEGDRVREDGKQVFKNDDGVVFSVANRQQGEKDARACLHAYRHTDPRRRAIYFVPEGTILDPALTLAELSRRAGGSSYGFPTGSQVGFTHGSMFFSVAGLPIMSKAGIEVPEGASFENPATWIDYFRNREWVFRVVWNDRFEGMNDGLFPLL